MELSDRKKQILRAVVENYIETAEPVGSKALSENAGLNVSSATIRNEMAELEDMGFLEQPHTSAGRVPSHKGYRMYVNELMQYYKLTIEETEEINRGLRVRMQQLDKLLSDAGRLTSLLTSYPAYALTTASAHITISRFDLIYIDQNTFIIVAMLSNNTVKNKLVHIPTSVEPEYLVKLATVFNANFTNITEENITYQLINITERAVGDNVGIVSIIASFAIESLRDVKNSETYITGASHLLEHPEFQDVGKAQKLLNYLSDESGLLQLPVPDDGKNVKITIGTENIADELKDSSVIVARYDAGDDMQGLIGIVGPTRMDYSKVAARLLYIANGLSGLLSSGQLPPPKNDT